MLFVLAAIAAPLLGAGLIAALRDGLGERVAKIGVAAVGVSLAAALAVLYQATAFEPVVFTPPGLPAVAAPIVLLDRLAAVMMVLITGVSLVIHVYSRRYMQGDSSFGRFFALLGLLTSVLLLLVTSGHLLWLLAAWHAVTWLLQALIALNRSSAAARRAGRTTLRVQAFGDAAFLIAIVLLYADFHTFDVTVLFRLLQEAPAGNVTVITLLLVLPVMTKSAQFPFHVWLPGTIEAPTPVSAMLHAGIVNAGGFLVNRLAPLYGSSPATLYVLFGIGALTALVGASTMLTQTSIKRRLVYSTMGQMGYMVMECGLGAFALAIFHLCAHGLFKATLFLNSGEHIHKAREDFALPERHPVHEPPPFSMAPWVTGLAITLLLPLVILLMAHGVVQVPLFEAQGTVIFLFFAWVTSAQAMFSLYRINAGQSWDLSLAMMATLALIGLTYLWAAESFMQFLYPAPGESAAYFQAAAWPQALFDTFVVVAALAIVAVWFLLYAHAHGYRVLRPARLERAATALYVTFLNAVYVEDAVRAVTPGSGPRRLRRRR